MEVEHKLLREMHTDLLNCELTISFTENNLDSKEKELDEKEKWLAEKQLQNLAAMRKEMEEVQAA
jgi:hypothetical protein